MLERIKALAESGDKAVPGGIRSILAGAAIAWGTRTSARLASEAMGALTEAQEQGRVLGAMVDARVKQLESLEAEIEDRHATIEMRLHNGEYDNHVIGRAYTLGYRLRGPAETSGWSGAYDDFGVLIPPAEPASEDTMPESEAVQVRRAEAAGVFGDPMPELPEPELPASDAWRKLRASAKK